MCNFTFRFKQIHISTVRSPRACNVVGPHHICSSQPHTPPKHTVLIVCHRSEAMRPSQRSNIVLATLLMCIVGLSTWVYFASRKFVDNEVDQEFSHIVTLTKEAIDSLDKVALDQLSILHTSVEVGYTELCNGRDPTAIFPLRCHEDFTPLSAEAYGALSHQLMLNLPSVIGSSLIPHVRNDTERQEWEVYMTAVLNSSSPLFFSTYRGSPAPLPPNSGPYFPLALSEHFVLQDLAPNAGYILQGAAVSGQAALYAAQYQGTVLAIITQAIYHDSSLPLPDTFRDDNVAGFVAIQALLDQTMHQELAPLTEANKGIWIGISEERDGNIYAGLNGAIDQFPEPAPTHDVLNMRSAGFETTFFDRTFKVRVVEASPLETKFQEVYPFLNATAAFLIMAGMVILGRVWQAKHTGWAKIEESANIHSSGL